MFDFAWSEIALIAVVALIAIGPKDMPVAIKAVTDMVKKARRMAAEFQTHVDEMVRDADLADVKNSINEIRNFDLKGTIEKAVDADGSIRKSFEDPTASASSWTAPASDPLPEAAVAAPVAVEAVAAEDGPPAFIPPEIANAPEPPDFIPPEQGRRRRA